MLGIIENRPIAEESLDPQDIRAALDRVTSSDIFRSSRQLAEFLRYVVDVALSGEGSRLKAMTIAIDVLGRGSDFDPQIDPIVRVEATRLRHAIERYYAGPGRDDEIVIDIPRGTYAPIFFRRIQKPTGNDPAFYAPPLWRRVSSFPSITALTIVAALGVAGLACLAWWRDSGGGDITASISGNSLELAHPSLAQNGIPTLEIEPLKVSGPFDSQSLSAELLRMKLQDVFARFDAINIAAPSTHGTLRNGKAAANARSRADYRLSGTIHYGQDRTSSVDFQLIDLRSSTVIWSKTFDKIGSVQDRAAVENKIASDLGATLLQPFGVIRAHDRARLQHGETADPRYVCILQTFDAFRSFDAAEHSRVRDCLEHLNSGDREFGVGLPYLAAIYNREHLFGLGARGNDTPALDRALVVARRGVELAPASARAYRSLFVVLFNRQNVSAAFAAGDRALELNRYDPSIVSEYGGRLILNGEIERGLTMMRKAAAQGPVRPSWHHYFMFLGNYFNGKLTEANFHAEQLPVSYPLGFLARALAAAAAGNTDRARIYYDRLVEMQPEFGSNPRRWLTKFFPDRALVNRIVDDFSSAGLITSG